MSAHRSARIVRIRSNIQHCISTVDHNRPVIASVTRLVAELVAEVLADPAHPLHHELEELGTAIQMTEFGAGGRSADPSRTSSHQRSSSGQADAGLSPDELQLAAWFSPQPAISASAIRRCWRIQLLLLVGVGLPSGAKAVADALGRTLDQVEAAARRGAQNTTLRWNAETYLQRLDEAVDLLVWDGPLVRLEGRMLCQGAKQVKLSMQQSAFIRCLSQSFNEFVSLSDLQEAGVNNPTKIRSQINNKLGTTDVQLTILAHQKKYKLTETRVHLDQLASVPTVTDSPRATAVRRRRM